MTQNVKTEKHNEKSQSLARSGAMAPARLFTAPGELLRWGPFTAMARMIEEMERTTGLRSSVENGGIPMWTPAIEVSQHNGDYQIRAELAGLKPEDVKVEVNGDALVLEGDRKFEHEETKDGVYRSERQYGHFYRSIPLPEGADVEHAHARFENGVLEVTVPVAEVPRSHRQIPVEAGSTAAKS
jgi:HSP20 family protein